MMRKILSNILIIIWASFSFGQTHIDSTLHLLPSWNKGESKTYEITSVFKISTDGQPSINSNTTKLVSLTVIDIQGNLMDLEWKYQDVQFIDSLSQNNPFSVMMNTIEKDITVQYTVDRKGEGLRIRNYEEISNKVNARVDSTISSFSKSNNIDDKQVKQLEFQYSMTFSTEKQIDLIVLHDLFEYHKLYGKEYIKGKTISIVEEPADQIRVEPDRLEVKLTEIDSKNQTCYFECKLISPFAQKMSWDKTVLKSYKFSLPDNFLIEHTSKMKIGEPTPTTDYYRIKLVE